MGRIIILLLMHLTADFFMQGKKLNILKAFKLPYLFEHVGIYTLFFIVIGPFLLGLTFMQGLVFSLINGAFHFAIDFKTSKLKMKYMKTDESKYIITIGVDHTLHIIILIMTYLYLYPNAMNAVAFFK